MKTRLYCIIATGLILAVSTPALGQGNARPVIQDLTWEISRYVQTIGSVNLYGSYNPFDPSTDKAFELDLIRMTIEVTDADFDGTEGDAAYYIVQSGWVVYPGYPSPEPPPIAADFHSFFPEEDGLYPQSNNVLTIVHIFQIPQFSGANQARLRGLIDYDVEWYVVLGVSNSQSPGCIGSRFGAISGPCDEIVTWSDEFIFALKNALITVPNPPPFADAGTDRTLAPGIAILDGSRSIDLYNLGFNTDSDNIFAKDTLTYTWEWISGPERVVPVQDVDTDPIATVNLATEGTYVYRLTVKDNYNSIPSTDTVTLTITQLADNHPPLAKIDTDPSGKSSWTVGQTITLVSESTDPDDDELSYRWQQTDELGGDLPMDLMVKNFQPLSGVAEDTASWQALLPGTYYFRLLINDGQYSDTATVSIQIQSASAAGETLGADSTDASNEFTPLLSPGTCGAGYLPWALAPLAFCLRRRLA